MMIRYRFAFDSYQSPYELKLEWYPECKNREYDFRTERIIMSRDGILWACDAIFHYYNTQRELEKARFDRVIASGDHLEFISLLRKYLLNMAFISHNRTRECGVDMDREIHSIINVFRLVRPGLDRKFLDIYLNMLASMSIDYDFVLRGFHPVDEDGKPLIINFQASQSYLEHTIAEQFGMEESPDISLDTKIYIIDKLFHQYAFRVYLIDIQSSRKTEEYFYPVDISKLEIIIPIENFIDRKEYIRDFDKYNPMVVCKNGEDYSMVVFLSYLLTKYKMHERYIIEGQSYANRLFLRTLMCGAELVLHFSGNKFVKNEKIKESGLSELEFECRRGYYLVCWIAIIKQYFSEIEWNEVRKMAAENTAETVLKQTQHLFSDSGWADLRNSNYLLVQKIIRKL